MEITYKLQVFEGPLDLLLHLIDINKIDIYDIPIALITDQYLAYMQSMEMEDMDITSDFLVMAATLLHIKSRMLIPVEQAEASGDGEDPRMELVERLLEYKTYKYMAGELKNREMAAEKMLFKPMTIPEDMEYIEPPVDLDDLVGDMNLSKLHAIYLDVMKKQTEKIDPIRSKYGKIEQEPVKLTDKMSHIRRILSGSTHRSINFRQLLENAPTKEEVIVTFLAVLELMKDGTVTIVQKALFDDIFISQKDDATEVTE